MFYEVWMAGNMVWVRPNHNFFNFSYLINYMVVSMIEKLYSALMSEKSLAKDWKDDMEDKLWSHI
jgi:hypothetical protein